jgi:hypothetical protein
MLTRYRVGVFPSLLKMKVQCVDIDQMETWEDEGNLFDMLDYIDGSVDLEDCTVVIQTQGLIAAKFNLWKKFKEVFAKRFKYWTWEKRRGKYIPEEYTDADLQAEYFSNLQDYGVYSERAIVAKIVTEYYKRMDIEVLGVEFADVREKIMQPRSKKPLSLQRSDLTILKS